MKILITGAGGFIGRNLRAQLLNLGYTDLILFERDSSLDELKEELASISFVFHFAGVNRPEREEEFWIGNVEFTANLLELLRSAGAPVPVLFTSSIQAQLDNPYGRSKRRAEELLLHYAERTGSKVYIYRLPNVFGKWARPNYNSAVATFCHNVARGLPIEIHDPERELTLVYIDDVVNEFLSVMEHVNVIDTGYRDVSPVYRTKLKDLAEKIIGFNEARKRMVIPPLADTFDRKLYATFVSYLPAQEISVELEMKRDERGWLSEFIKSHHAGQIFISKTKPGITRGNHWHHTKVEKFLVIQGEALIRLRKIDSSEVIEYKVDGDRLQVIDIPPGYTHSITNIGETELITLFWASEIFDPDKPDTYRMEV